MATIKAIEGHSVHQIQSGQVIVDLCSVVKELVENSLDAGASSIEVRFKNHGLDSIEVQDNGKGIPPEDFETVALKHHTSKLSNYEDLASLDTFGFRGEALSSLCALSKFHILTARAEDGAVGKRLDFEGSGKLKSTSVAAVQKGTTVSVDELFHNLPVRRKELEKNIKREYGKVIGFLHAYACISAGVRFSVSNQMPKGKRIAVFSTKSNTTTKENIVNVFGAKTLLALIRLDLHLEMEPSKGPSTQSARTWSTQATDRSLQVHVQGHISRPVFGEGRQAPDRQMFFVNSRPCLLPQVSKAFNEVYKSFNVTQSPFIFANLVMDTHTYDVNVSPDKRTILLHDQTALLESLKRALIELFEQTDHTVPQSTLPNKKLPAYQPLTVPRHQADETSPSGEEAAEMDSDQSDDEPEASARSSVASNLISNGARKGTPPSLIQNWLGRDTEDRDNTPAPRRPSAGLSNNKQASVSALQSKQDAKTAEEVAVARTKPPTQSRHYSEAHVVENEAATLASNNANVSNPAETERRIQPLQEPDPLSTAYDDLFSQRPAHLPRPVYKPDVPRLDLSTVATEKAMSETRSPRALEPQIPTIATSSQKATPGPVQNAFDHMRPKRTPLQTAEITIGDTTTTTVIGSSPAYKKRRVYAPENSQSITKFGASPLLARGLRNFAAPGSQMAVDSSDLPRSSIGQLVAKSAESGESSSEEEDTGEAEVVTGEHDRTKPPEDDVETSDPLDQLIPAPVDYDDYDADYVDEQEKKVQEDEKVARLIQEAEDAAGRAIDDNLKRASQVLKNGGNRKESTLQLMCMLNTSIADMEKRALSLQSSLEAYAHAKDDTKGDNAVVKDELDDSNAESKLSLTVSKPDFERMHIVGQFNLGFILAIRPASGSREEDELFIIDQHAADEKYNYERLQRTVTLQSQRLVRPKPLELTAIEEEIILNNSDALKANGFEIETTSDIMDNEETPSGRRCRLLTLPISGGKTFDLTDLEELLHLLSEAPGGGAEIPRPKKVQRMLAMRACRSSIMVGKTLTSKQMQKVVKHMGEMEKPWNCPHGRPTMRHLAGLGAWCDWQEGDVVDADEQDGDGGRQTDWKSWLEQRG